MTNQSPAEGLRQQIEDWIDNRRFDLDFPQGINFSTIQKIAEYLEPNVTAYAATVEREARIDEMLHTTYLLGQGYCRCNHLPDGDTEFIPQADRLAALQGPQEEPDNA